MNLSKLQSKLYFVDKTYLRIRNKSEAEAYQGWERDRYGMQKFKGGELNTKVPDEPNRSQFLPETI